MVIFHSFLYVYQRVTPNQVRPFQVHQVHDASCAASRSARSAETSCSPWRRAQACRAARQRSSLPCQKVRDTMWIHSTLCVYMVTLCSGWWYTYSSEKYEFVSWDDYSQYMDILKNVANHQSVYIYIYIYAIKWWHKCTIEQYVQYFIEYDIPNDSNII